MPTTNLVFRDNTLPRRVRGLGENWASTPITCASPSPPCCCGNAVAVVGIYLALGVVLAVARWQWPVRGADAVTASTPLVADKRRCDRARPGGVIKPELRSAVAMALIDRSSPLADARIVLAGAVALHQLDLQEVERLDIGQPQPDRGVEGGMLFEQPCHARSRRADRHVLGPTRCGSRQRRDRAGPRPRPAPHSARRCRGRTWRAPSPCWRGWRRTAATLAPSRRAAPCRRSRPAPARPHTSPAASLAPAPS